MSLVRYVAHWHGIARVEVCHNFRIHRHPAERFSDMPRAGLWAPAETCNLQPDDYGAERVAPNCRTLQHVIAGAEPGRDFVRPTEAEAIIPDQL